MSIVVESGGTSIFLAGDASYDEASMLGGRVDGISPDEAVTLRTLEIVKRFAAERPTVFLPSHDPEAAKRLSSITKGGR